MSAEILRRAVSRIRHDVEFGQAHGDDTFLLAVADWLEDEAADAKAYGPEFDVEHLFPMSFAAARAYLGESA